MQRQQPPPLLLAILQGDTEALRSLLQRGVTSEQLNQPVRMVCKVEHVCEPGEMMTPLALAAGWDKAGCVALLLEAHASPSARRAPSEEDHYKTVPLHWACATQSVDCAMLLLDAPGGAATLDEKLLNCGLTPLGSAALDGDISTARLLVERGCDVNEPRDSGASPLYGACQEGRVEVAKLLLQARANIDQLRTHSGASPLFASAGHGHGDVVELMLAAGADTSIVAKDGFTALSIALAEGRAEGVPRGSNPRKAVALLQAHAAALESGAPRAPPQLPEAPVTPAELVGLVRRGQILRLKQLLARPAVRAILDLPAGRAGDTVGGVPIGGRTPLVAACCLKSTFSLETVRVRVRVSVRLGLGFVYH